MILSIVELTFKPGSADAGLAAVRESVSETRCFEGCLAIDVARKLNDPQTLVIAEKWQSPEHDAAYRQFRATQGRSRLADLIAGPPVVSSSEILANV